MSNNDWDKLFKLAGKIVKATAEVVGEEIGKVASELSGVKGGQSKMKNSVPARRLKGVGIVTPWGIERQKQLRLLEKQLVESDPFRYYQLQIEIDEQTKLVKKLRSNVRYEVEFSDPSNLYPLVELSPEADKAYILAELWLMGRRRSSWKQRALLIKAIEADERHIWARLSLAGNIKGIKSRENYLEAAEQYRAVIRLVPTYLPAYERLAELLSSTYLDQISEAVDVYLLGIRQRSFLPDIYLKAAAFFAKQQLIEKQAEAYLIGLEQFRGNEKLRQGLKGIMNQLSVELRESAESVFARSLKVKRKDLVPIHYLTEYEKESVGLRISYLSSFLFGGTHIDWGNMRLFFWPLLESLVGWVLLHEREGKKVGQGEVKRVTERLIDQFDGTTDNLTQLIQYPDSGVKRIQKLLWLFDQSFRFVVKEVGAHEDDAFRSTELARLLIPLLRREGRHPLGRGKQQVTDQDWFDGWWRKERVSRDNQYAQLGRWSGYVGGGFASSNKDPDDWEHPYTK